MTATPNKLYEKIAALITLNGPITLAEYMHICMADPQHGYYKTQQSIGRKGDFITAPEISQMFGELIGAWCIAVWRDLGKPNPFCLAELGPGKGTLMSDLLRTAKADPSFLDAAKIVLVETSEHLVNKQKNTLPENLIASGKISWLIDINELPDLPTIIIGNEFLDVVPFRQYIKTKSGWNEIGIGLSPENKLQKVALAGNLDAECLPVGAEKETEGAVFEMSPAREAIVETICHHLTDNSGACLLIDYGHLASGFGDTFQAISNHSYADTLQCPGQADLTSHVDFQTLEKAAKKYAPNIATTTQSEFLLSLGLLERAGSLGSGKDNTTQDAIRTQVERIASPDHMGELFKVLGFSTNKIKLPGF